MTANERLAAIKANLPRQTYPTDALSRRERDARDMLAALEVGLKPLLPHYESPSVRAFGCVCIVCEAVEAIIEALGVDQ